MNVKLSSFIPALVASSLALFVSGCTGPNLFQRLANLGAQGPCVIVIVILDVIFLVELFNSSRTSGDKLLWALLIIFLPLLGCLLYYFMGREKNRK